MACSCKPPKAAPARGIFRYHALNLFSWLLRLPLLKAVPQPGGQAAIANEVKRIHALTAAGVPVAPLVAQGPVGSGGRGAEPAARRGTAAAAAAATGSVASGSQDHHHHHHGHHSGVGHGLGRPAAVLHGPTSCQT